MTANEAREKWLTDDNYKVIREKVDYFMQARADFEKNYSYHFCFYNAF